MTLLFYKIFARALQENQNFFQSTGDVNCYQCAIVDRQWSWAIEGHRRNVVSL